MASKEDILQKELLIPITLLEKKIADKSKNQTVEEINESLIQFWFLRCLIDGIEAGKDKSQILNEILKCQKCKIGPKAGQSHEWYFYYYVP